MSLAEVESIFIPILLYPESGNLLKMALGLNVPYGESFLGWVHRLTIACVLADNDCKPIAITLFAV